MDQLSFFEAPPRPQELRQHNAITTARYDYSACQMDIMFYLLSCLGREDAPDKIYTIYLKDMEQTTGRKWNYQQLQEATGDMGSRMFVIGNEKKVSQLWMMDKVDYMLGEGHIVIGLTKSIRPYLFDLKENFTSYGLQSALKLTSKYSKRIYQLVSQWKDKESTRTYTLHEFKCMLYLKDPEGKEKELFKNISQLKERALEVAIRQISEHTELRIGYELLKKGHSFESIRFSIAHQKPTQLPMPSEQPSTAGRRSVARQHLENLGIVQPTLVTQILDDSKLVDQLFKFIYDQKTDKVKVTKNAGGLFLKMSGLR